MKKLIKIIIYINLNQNRKSSNLLHVYINENSPY